LTINRRFGLLAGFVFLAYAFMKRMTHFKVLMSMTLTLDTIDRRRLKSPQKYSGEIVAGDAIRSLTRALCILITAVISYMRTEGPVP